MVLHEIDDVRIQNIRPLMAPEILLEDYRKVPYAQQMHLVSGRIQTFRHPRVAGFEGSGPW